MAGIRGRDTKPEILVRKALHANGLRFRLHVAKLPGKPDVVLPRHRAVVFVNGCFWHGHNCRLFRWPSTRPDFWRAKIERNRSNDARAVRELMDLGWRVAVLWECAIRSPAQEYRQALPEWVRGSSSFGEFRDEEGLSVRVL